MATRNNDTTRLILISGHIFTLVVFGAIVLGMLFSFFFLGFVDFPEVFKTWGTAGIAYFMTNKFPDMVNSYISGGENDTKSNT